MTSFSEVYDAFFEKMEADEDFFNYFDLNEAEAMALAHDRAHTYLKESIAIVLRRCEADVAFDDFDDEIEQFNVDLTLVEIDLLASLMFEQEYRRQLSKLKALKMQHVPTTLQVFSPANERKTMLSAFAYLQDSNATMLDNYAAKDRGTYKYKAIDYDSYAEDEDE